MSLHRALVATFVVAALAVAAPTAYAASVPSGCAELQSTIDTVSTHANHGEGEVVVLNGMCEASNLKSAAGVTIPAESNISIEGAPGTTSGFDGAGVTESLLHSAGFEPVDSITLRNLTFQHANVTTPAGAALSLRASHVTIEGDSFSENTLHGSLGGAVFIFIPEPKKPLTCPAAGGPSAVTITGSSFRANELIQAGFGGGGALWIGQPCAFPGSVLEGNLFAGNTIEFSGTGEALGGAFFFENDSFEFPTPITQRANVFDSNGILSSSTTSNYGGGGEWVEGASLTSLGDRFTGNSIPGTAGPKWSWGGGLGILNTGCNALTPTESTLENAVVARNSIGGGTPSALGGAGIYVGCSPSSTHPNHLSLLDSTVTQNSVASGGIAGVDGNPGDQLRIANSILAGDSGGDEIGGFNGVGGSLSAAFSDMCASGGGSPLAGEGNICADPLLANSGNPSSLDVRETTASPTIDAGSNALVPGGLASDFYGNTRILSARSFIPACSPGAIVEPTLYPAVVDMGASELGPVAIPAYALACAPGPPKPLSIRPLGGRPYSRLSISQRANGLLRLTFEGLAAGRLGVVASFKLTKTIVVGTGTHRRRVKRVQTLTYGTLNHRSSSPANVTVSLTPVKRALGLLKRHRRLKVTLRINFVPPGVSSASRTVATATTAVVYKAPHKRRHR